MLNKVRRGKLMPRLRERPIVPGMRGEISSNLYSP